MDLFGIGLLELVFVLLVALIVLGPARMVEMAGRMGKYWREAQRMLREAADAAAVNLDAKPETPREDAPAEPAEESVARGGDGAGPEEREEAERHG